MTFAEYLNKDDNDFNTISEYYITFLNNFSARGFVYEDQLKLKGATDKFTNSASQLSYQSPERRDLISDLIFSLIYACKYYRKINSKSNILFLRNNSKYRALERVQEAFGNLYSECIDIINNVTSSYSYKYMESDLKLNGFYQPQNTNKEKVKQLIQEAIQLINEDYSLTEKSKKQIVEYLNKIINKLDYEYISWTSILGYIKEAIIVLGALGSFIGGYSTLNKAEEKLEETTKIIQKSSITINQKIINETFKVDNITQLNELNKTMLKIESNNPTEK